jgi:hypothetical protein
MSDERYYAETIAGNVACDTAEDMQDLIEALGAINAVAALTALHPAEAWRIVEDDVSPADARVPPMRPAPLVEWETNADLDRAAGFKEEEIEEYHHLTLYVTAPLALAVEVNETIEGAGLFWDLVDDGQEKLDALLGDDEGDNDR